jgi:putative peptidoglycan lipid II flippase
MSRTNGGSFFVALGILLSRISGLLRDRVFAHFLGNSMAAGAFRAALRIPNFLQNLFGEGVLSASFIPIYARLNADGNPETAGKLAGVVASLLGLMVAAFVLAGVWLTPLIVDLVAPGFEGELRALVIEFVRILVPGIGLLVLSAWCFGILNSHRKFFLPYVAPVLWNASMIAALLVYGHSHSQESLAVILAWASVVGSALQFAIQLPFVFRCSRHIRFSLDTAMEPVRHVFRNFLPMVFGRGVLQLSAYLDGFLASFLGASAVASLAYAQTIFLLPVSLFGMAVAAAELPEMSIATGHDKLRARLIAGRRQIGFFVVPSMIAFIFLGKYVVAALYQTGAFGPEDTLFVWYILLACSFGLLVSTWGRLYSSAFYALSDMKTPLKIGIFRLAVSAGLSLLFIFPLREQILEVLAGIPGFRLPYLPEIEPAMGAVALSVASSIAGVFEYLLLKSVLRRRIGDFGIPAQFGLKVWGSALTAAAASLWIFGFDFHLHAPFYDFGPLCAMAGFGAIYVILTAATGVEESGRYLKRLRPTRPA